MRLYNNNKNIYKAPSIQIYPFRGAVHEYIIQVLQNYNIKFAKVNKISKICIRVIVINNKINKLAKDNY